jgi:hypothetical protein
VIAVDDPPRHVTISHDDIPGLMPAMTMELPLRSAAVLAGVTPGMRVRFLLVRDGTRLTVTQIVPVGLAGAGRPGLHDHTPHHGGVVSMVGLQHLEAVAAPDGRVRVYLSDVWRQPEAVDGVEGTVMLDLPEGPRTLALRAGAEALEATGPALRGTRVKAHVRLERGGPPIEAHFVLPLRADTTGTVLLQMGPCAPLAAAVGVRAGRAPRCALAFPRRVAALAAVPDASTVLVSVASAWVTAWRVADGEPAGGLAPAPPREVRADHPPHDETATAIVVNADGSQAVVTIGLRLLRYAVASGRLLRQLPDLEATARELAWSGEGTRLVVPASEAPHARLLAAEDGRELARIAAAPEATAVAAAADGRVAIGSSSGTVAVLDARRGPEPRLLTGGARAIDGLAFANDRLISTAADGVLRIWNPEEGVQIAAADVGQPLGRLAVSSDGTLVASAGGDRVIRLHDPGTGAVVEALAWHGGGLTGLAWVGTVLVSADDEGRLALWDLADRLTRQP